MTPKLDPEYRRCPATGRWVIVAPARALRPMTLPHSQPYQRRGNGGDPRNCPLCEGREAETPPEIYAVRRLGNSPIGPGWLVRVVANKYPAVHPIGNPVFRDDGDMFDALPGFGEHELIIDCPYHEISPTELSVAELALVLGVYRDRILALGKNPMIAYVTAFKNVGAEAGASLAHSHSQLIAMPIVPEGILHELESAAAYHSRRGTCVYCDMVRAERAAGVRVVAETQRFLAVCPFAPRLPYEVWVLPSDHISHYETISDGEANELAGLLRMVLGKIDGALAEPAYNYYIHTGPIRLGELPHFHWHLEIIPRTNRQAGFEWGSGCFINPVSPERAAYELRQAVPPAGDEVRL